MPRGMNNKDCGPDMVLNYLKAPSLVSAETEFMAGFGKDPGWLKEHGGAVGHRHLTLLDCDVGDGLQRFSRGRMDLLKKLSFKSQWWHLS